MSTAEKIRTVCPHCGQKMRIKMKYLGKTIPCPTCKTPFNVESLPEEDEVGSGTGADMLNPDVSRLISRDEQPAEDAGATASAGFGEDESADVPPLADDDDGLAGLDEPLDELPPVEDEMGDDLADEEMADEPHAHTDNGYHHGADDAGTDEELMTAEEVPDDDDVPPLADDDGMGDEADELPEPGAAHGHHGHDEADERIMPARPDISQPPSPPARRHAGSAAAASAAPSEPTPRASRPAPTSRVTPSKFFQSVDLGSEAAIAEFNFGRSGLLVPETGRMLVTDQSVYVMRTRDYLFGLFPGADFWFTRYPIDARELQNARVFYPSIGRMLFMFLVALLLGGAVIAAMQTKPEFLGFSAAAANGDEGAALVSADATDMQKDLFGWLHDHAATFDLNDPATWWWVSIPFILVFVWYAWRFKARFETDAFRVPVGRGKKKWDEVNKCLKTMMETRRQFLESNHH